MCNFNKIIKCFKMENIRKPNLSSLSRNLELYNFGKQFLRVFEPFLLINILLSGICLRRFYIEKFYFVCPNRICLKTKNIFLRKMYQLNPKIRASFESFDNGSGERYVALVQKIIKSGTLTSQFCFQNTLSPIVAFIKKTEFLSNI